MASLFLYKIKRILINGSRAIGLMFVINRLNNVRLRAVKFYCNLTGRNPLEHVYNDKFFNIDQWKHVLKDSPRVVAETIVRLYHPKTVIDIGCGGGFYVNELGKLGVSYLGLDGSAAAARNLVIDKKHFLLQDVTEKFSLPEKYDCAICFEVAEHIPTDKSRVLVENLSALSDLIFFTAARPGQGGHDHINERQPQFWIDIFQDYGLKFLPDDTERMQKIFTDRTVIFWITENLLIFRRQHGAGMLRDYA